MATSAKRKGYSYRITDLDYPAVTVLSPKNALGAKISGGKAFTFGKSVAKGVSNLQSYYKTTNKSCPNTKWVLGGFSQGTLVVAQAIEKFDRPKVIYMGLFGDPWTYLPEGKGLMPKACYGRGLSSYRVFAPECKTYSGTLGMRIPYVLSGMSGKVGLWCNRADYFCGSTKYLINTAGHGKYAEYKEIFWMADIVERKLPKKRSVVEEDEVIEDPGEIIRAHLPADEYPIGMDGKVLLDASGSFSYGHEIVEYLWSVNGGDFWSTGAEPTTEREVFFPNQEIITLRIVDDVGNTAETTARIRSFEGTVEDNTIPAPKNVEANYSDGEISLDWTDKHNYRAKYLLVRINGVDLDYVPLTELATVIDGIEDVNNTKLEVAWMTDGYEGGKWAEIELPYIAPQEINIDPVETGISDTNPSLLALLIFAMVVFAVYKKYLPH